MPNAVYPGTFDPITRGHLDILKRSLQLFERVVVAVAANPTKKCLLPAPQRLQLFRMVTDGMPGVRVELFHGMLADYVNSLGATVIVRGIRFVSDFEHELQMALLNSRLQPQIETILLAPSEEYAFINASIVREVLLAGGPVDHLVPEKVAPLLRQRVHAIMSPHNLEENEEASRS